MAKKGRFLRKEEPKPKKTLAIVLAAAVIVGAIGIGIAIWHNSKEPEEIEPDQPAMESAPIPGGSETAPTQTEAPPSDAEKILAGMTLEQKVYQLFVVRPEDVVGGSSMTSCPSDLAARLEEKPVGGFIFFASNIVNRNQTIRMLADCQEAAKIPMFLGVDEEGGRVRRVGSNPDMKTTQIPSMSEIEDAAAAKEVGITIGSELKELGFNLDFAPVADVKTHPDNKVVGSRAFSTDATEAAKQVSACVEGFRESGMISCLKHFPGHGNTVEDSHYGYAATYKSMVDLERLEFLPFQAGIAADVPMVMMGHISLPNVNSGDELPASMSPFWMQEILRGKLGFDGVIVTDSLEMAAITDAYPNKGESAVQALLGGADIILMPDSLSKGAAAILAAVTDGTISESRIDESVLRILNLKLEYGIMAAPEN